MKLTKPSDYGLKNVIYIKCPFILKAKLEMTKPEVGRVMMITTEIWEPKFTGTQ